MPGIWRRTRVAPRALLAVLLAVLLAGLALLTTACRSPEPRFTTGKSAEVTADGLHRAKARVAGVLYLRPGVDLKPYDRVMLQPVVLRFSRVHTLQRAGVPQTLDLVELRQQFEGIFREELDRSTVFRRVEEPGVGVLRVSAELHDLVVATPDPETPDTVLLQTPGHVTVLLELSDSLSHEVVLRASQRRKIEPAPRLQPSSGVQGKPTTAISSTPDALRAFRQWARLIREWLDEVREIPPLPGAATADSGA